MKIYNSIQKNHGHKPMDELNADMSSPKTKGNPGREAVGGRHKTMTNLEVAELLRAVAAAYQLHSENKNRFKIIAYQRAADSAEHASSELKDLWDEGKLDDVAGIG